LIAKWLNMKKLFQSILILLLSLQVDSQSVGSVCKSSFGFKNSDNARVAIQATSPGSLHQLYDSTGFTWEAWFKLDSAIINGSILISVEDSVFCEDIFLGFGNGTIPKALSFFVRENGPGCATTTVESLQNISPHQWYHVAAVCDYSNAILKLYLNGSLLSTAAISTDILNNKMVNDHLVQIGNLSYLYPNGIDGSIDEVRFCNKVRTQPEIQNNMISCSLPLENGLVAYFKADENMNFTAHSAVNSNFAGLLQKAAWSTQSPINHCSNLVIDDTLIDCGTYNFYGLVNSDAINNIGTWQWYFGDGGTSNAQNPIHTYTSARLYNVNVVFTDSSGCKESVAKVVNAAYQKIQQNDTTICEGKSLNLSIGVTSSPIDTILFPGSLFEYTFDIPPPAWMNTMGGWPSGLAPFGSETDGEPDGEALEFNYNTYWPPDVEDHPDGYDLYVRRNINLSGFILSTIQWHIGVDNGFALYVNGYPITTAWDGGYTNRWEYNGSLPVSILNQGNNIIALALTDDDGATAFDMMIDGQPNNQGISVLWSTGDTTTRINVTPKQTTTYSVLVTKGTLTCRDSVTITVKPASASTINATICEGENFFGYTTSGTYIDRLSAINGCDSIRTINLVVKAASHSDVTQSICEGQSYLGYTKSGIYIDTLVAANGCDSIRTLRLTVLQKPNPDLGADKDLCKGDSLVLDPGSFDSYLWQDGSVQNKTIIRRPGLYSVIVKNVCGSGSDEILIKEGICGIHFPSAFTPNNNGRNDLFKVLGGVDLNDYHLVIYNRWGQKIFETTDRNKGWDGNFNGLHEPSGVFVWYCEFRRKDNVNRTKMTGTVTLIR
jgi:gliding motility-associated-like protein